ncbi:hypothetical protein YC2023_044790 [Brassica napus]
MNKRGLKIILFFVDHINGKKQNCLNVSISDYNKITSLILKPNNSNLSIKDQKKTDGNSTDELQSTNQGREGRVAVEKSLNLSGSCLGDDGARESNQQLEKEGEEEQEQQQQPWFSSKSNLSVLS